MNKPDVSKMYVMADHDLVDFTLYIEDASYGAKGIIHYRGNGTDEWHEGEVVSIASSYNEDGTENEEYDDEVEDIINGDDGSDATGEFIIDGKTYYVGVQRTDWWDDDDEEE